MKKYEICSGLPTTPARVVVLSPAYLQHWKVLCWRTDRVFLYATLLNSLLLCSLPTAKKPDRPALQPQCQTSTRSRSTRTQAIARSQCALISETPSAHRRASHQLAIAAVHCVMFGLAPDSLRRLRRRFQHKGVGASDWWRIPGAGAEMYRERVVSGWFCAVGVYVLAGSRPCGRSVLCRASWPVRVRRSCASLSWSLRGSFGRWAPSLLWELIASSPMRSIIPCVLFCAPSADEFLAELADTNIICALYGGST